MNLLRVYFYNKKQGQQAYSLFRNSIKTNEVVCKMLSKRVFKPHQYELDNILTVCTSLKLQIRMEAEKLIDNVIDEDIKDRARTALNHCSEKAECTSLLDCSAICKFGIEVGKDVYRSQKVKFGFEPVIEDLCLADMFIVLIVSLLLFLTLYLVRTIR